MTDLDGFSNKKFGSKRRLESKKSGVVKKEVSEWTSTRSKRGVFAKIL